MRRIARNDTSGTGGGTFGQCRMILPASWPMIALFSGALAVIWSAAMILACWDSLLEEWREMEED